MQRPRNRQPRPQRQRQDDTPRRHHGPRPQHDTGTTDVPSIQQVIAGALVSIVLKQDQPTGRQVQGVVQDILTRGNHPRGIKVRLTDGRVGRVQSMASGSSAVSADASVRPSRQASAHNGYVTDALPSRSLADFLQAEIDSVNRDEPNPRCTTDVVCPICNEFRGDEIAVSRHVDDHLH